MNYLKNIISPMIAVTLCCVGSVQAEPAKDDAFSYQGESFVLEQNDGAMKKDGKDTTSNQAVGIYKGAQVKSLQSKEIGKITGTIIVKLKKNTSLRVQNAEVLHMAGNYYLVNYTQQTNLIEALKKLRQMPQVEDAQIEVQTNRLKTR